MVDDGLERVERRRAEDVVVGHVVLVAIVVEGDVRLAVVRGVDEDLALEDVRRRVRPCRGALLGGAIVWWWVVSRGEGEGGGVARCRGVAGARGADVEDELWPIDPVRTSGT